MSKKTSRDESPKPAHNPIGADVQTWFDEEERRTPGFIAGVDLQVTKEAIAANLKALRLAAGLSQSEVARRAGILQPSLARIESGRTMPELELVTRIASALDCKVELRITRRAPANDVAAPKVSAASKFRKA